MANKAVNAITKFENDILPLEINFHDMHRLNSITNAIESNVEDSKTDSKVIENLCQAYIEATKLLPKDQGKKVRSLFRKCEKVVKDPSNWK